MFIRFVVAGRHDRSRQSRGVFTEMYRLEREGLLEQHEARWFHELEEWFNANLKRPDRLQTSKRRNAPFNAVTWLKANAVDHVTRMRQIAALLEHKDIAVEELHTERPGYVVYEDEHQVAALPFRDET